MHLSLRTKGAHERPTITESRPVFQEQSINSAQALNPPVAQSCRRIAAFQALLSTASPIYPKRDNVCQYHLLAIQVYHCPPDPR